MRAANPVEEGQLYLDEIKLAIETWAKIKDRHHELHQHGELLRDEAKIIVNSADVMSLFFNNDKPAGDAIDELAEDLNPKNKKTLLSACLIALTFRTPELLDLQFGRRSLKIPDGSDARLTAIKSSVVYAQSTTAKSVAKIYPTSLYGLRNVAPLEEGDAMSGRVIDMTTSSNIGGLIHLESRSVDNSILRQILICGLVDPATGEPNVRLEVVY